MTEYQVTVAADKWPTTVRVQASSWRSAAGRGITEWRKRIKYVRSDRITIQIVRAPKIKITNDNE